MRQLYFDLSEKHKPKVPKSQPKSALKAKRENKVASKKQKGVKFSSEVETHVIGERTWNDFKRRGATFKKGSFSPEEIKTLMNALCNFVKQ